MEGESEGWEEGAVLMGKGRGREARSAKGMAEGVLG